MSDSCYRRLTKYKYQLLEDYTTVIPVIGYKINTPFINLSENGNLLIKQKYAWNGANVAFDTKTFMRGSLIHDALYQLIRLEKLPLNIRHQADLILKDICKKDGMSSFRAYYVHLAVKWFGGGCAVPGSEEPDKKYYFR